MTFNLIEDICLKFASIKFDMKKLQKKFNVDKLACLIEWMNDLRMSATRNIEIRQTIFKAAKEENGTLV